MSYLRHHHHSTNTGRGAHKRTGTHTGTHITRQHDNTTHSKTTSTYFAPLARARTQSLAARTRMSCRTERHLAPSRKAHPRDAARCLAILLHPTQPHQHTPRAHSPVDAYEELDHACIRLALEPVRKPVLGNGELPAPPHRAAWCHWCVVYGVRCGMDAILMWWLGGACTCKQARTLRAHTHTYK